MRPVRTDLEGDCLVVVRKFIAGISDTALAAMSTFLLGAVAIRELPTAAVALYGAVFSGLIVVALIPGQLAYLPQRLHLNVAKGDAVMMTDLRADFHRARIPTILGAVVLVALALPVARTVDVQTFVATIIGATALSVLSPFQSHCRASLHLGSAHVLAAGVSGLTLLVQVATTILVLSAFQQSSYLLGLLLLCLALANGAGALLAATRRSVPVRDLPHRSTVRQLAGFVVPEFLAQGGGYLAVVLAVLLLGSGPVAALEAARIASSPIWIVASGLLAFVLPPMISAAARYRRSQYIELYVRFIAVLGASAGAWITLLAFASPLLAVVFDRPLNTNIAVSRVLVSSVDALSPSNYAALQALNQRRLLYIAAGSAAILPLIILVLTAPWLGIWAFVWALGAGGLLKAIISFVALIGRLQHPHHQN